LYFLVTRTYAAPDARSRTARASGGCGALRHSFMGELTIARERFEQSLALCRPEMHDSQIAQYGTDLGVAGHCYHALTLWHLGYPDQVVEESY
jgi:hypothetical protein